MRVRAAWVYDKGFPLDDAAHSSERTDPVSDDRLHRLLELGVLCNDATRDDGDPTERALVQAADDAGLDVTALRDRHPRRDEYPFSSERKRMTTVHDEFIAVKGAPLVVLDRSTRVLTDEGVSELTSEDRDRIRNQVETYADDALRVLGFAYRAPEADGDPEEDLVFVGLQGLLDPPRSEVRDAIAETQRAGIGVKMITGDNPATARAVAAQIGIDSDVVTGRDIGTMDEAMLGEQVETVDIFARAEPVHKVRILNALRENGHTVAMTGDGVNDAPALKSADVGIAMGIRGTDVAKQASDIILLDDNYATIRNAVRRGRTIFDNIWKFVTYLLSANAAEVLLVVIASLFGYLVLPAVQLLWINLLTDGLPALALGNDPTGDVMDRPPRQQEAQIVDNEMLTFITGAGVTVTVVMLSVLFYTLDGASAVTPYAMTMVFTGFVVFEFVKLYVVRWMRETPLVSNPWLALAVGTSLVLHLLVLYTPLRDYFGTVPLIPGDWSVLGGALLVGGSLLFLVGWGVNRRTPKRTSDTKRVGSSAESET